MGMGEDAEEQRDEQGDGPGSVFASFVSNDELLEKLKLLNYEKKFVSRSKAFKPLSRYYFVQNTNPGEQFFMFTSVSGWLIQQAGNTAFELPHEVLYIDIVTLALQSDDPNATVSRILNELRSKNVDVDFPPNKLKSGAGVQCLHVLNSLADLALANNNFVWQKANPSADDDQEDAPGADEAEMAPEEYEETDEVAMGEDDDEVAVMDLQDVSASLPEGAVQSILHSDTDAASWKMEVERVAPSLKVTIRQDAKMAAYRTAIGEVLALAAPQLDNLGSELGKALEKVAGREKYLNQQLESLISQFRAAQDRRAEIKQRYREASGGVTERTATLQQISEEIDQLKQQIDEQGARNSDGAPMVRLKQALVRLEQELIQMDVQIGVIEHALLQSQLRDRLFYANDLYGDN